MYSMAVSNGESHSSRLTTRRKALTRHEQLKGLVIALKIRFRPVETHTRSRTLKTPTASDVEIFRTAWSLVQSEPWDGRPVRLIGLGISG